MPFPWSSVLHGLEQLALLCLMGGVFAYAAAIKGFVPWPWFFTATPFSAIVLLLLPSAAVVQLDTATMAARRRRAHAWGLGLIAVPLGFLLVMFLVSGTISNGPNSYLIFP
ncbi:MAG: hypothetical protein ABI743_10650 [bacterium]